MIWFPKPCNHLWPHAYQVASIMIIVTVVRSLWFIQLSRQQDNAPHLRSIWPPRMWWSLLLQVKPILQCSSKVRDQTIHCYILIVLQIVNYEILKSWGRKFLHSLCSVAVVWNWSLYGWKFCGLCLKIRESGSSERFIPWKFWHLLAETSSQVNWNNLISSCGIICMGLNVSCYDVPTWFTHYTQTTVCPTQLFWLCPFWRLVIESIC